MHLDVLPSSLWLASPLSRELPPETELGCQGHHLASLFCTPCFPDEPRSCASPPSSSPPKESTRTARSRRCHRCLPRRSRAHRCKIHHRRPSSGPGDLPDVFLVRIRSGRTLFPSSSHVLAPPPPGHRRPSAPEKDGWAGLLTQPTWPAWPARVETEPRWSATMGHFNPGAKCLHVLVYFQEF
jgi:hypothetical protein